jgi:hypothetical protein
MELVNATRLVAGYTLGVEPSGREHVVVVAKGTYRLPEAGEAPELLEPQRALIAADTFTGEPGYSAPKEEVDFALRKPRCDVLLTGSAYAPQGYSVDRVPVGLRIGAWRKAFAVVGDRQWRSGIGGARPSAPAHFVRQAISYDVAFGGLDNFPEDHQDHRAYMRNPVGRGWHHHLRGKYVDGRPLPNTEELDRPVEQPDADYAPMAFGPLGRSWLPRLPLAGTYDQHWLDHVFPFLPADFRDDYYQAAPPDQQLPCVCGGEEVTLLNLTASGRTDFRLPAQQVPVTFFRAGGGHEERQAVLDTIAFHPDEGLFTLAWRASLPLKRNMLEISELLVGGMSRGWWRARELGKKWYPSLAALADAGDEDEDSA